jgi:hypothetical protein
MELRKQNKFFDFNATPSIEAKEKVSEQWTSKFIASHFLKIQSLEDDLLRLPTEDEFMFLQTDKAFNAFTFIPLVAKLFPIKELYASTYSISRKVIEALIEMHDRGMIEQITLLVSESMIKRNPTTIENLQAMCTSRPNIKVLYAWTHAKICIMKTQDFHFVIEGSGNWAENAHYEQYLFANSVGLYHFRKQLFTTIDMIKY